MVYRNRGRCCPLHLPPPPPNHVYYWFAAHYRFVSSSSQAIARKAANQTLRPPFVYEVIVVYPLVAARTAEVDVIVAMLVAANEFEGLNRGCAIDC